MCRICCSERKQTAVLKHNSATLESTREALNTAQQEAEALRARNQSLTADLSAAKDAAAAEVNALRS